MTDSVIIDLLVLTLLLAVNIRLFFITRGQKDALVLLSPVAFAICILSLLAWDLSLVKGGIFLISLLVLLENSHGLWRFFNQLYVDSFSPLLWLASVVNILLILALGFFTLIFRPLPPSQDIQVEQRDVLLVGTVHSGLSPRGSFEPTDVRILQLKPADTDSPWSERGSRLINPTDYNASTPHLPLVIWVTDGRSSLSRVEPIVTNLASLGYEVVVVDYNRNLVLSSKLKIQGVFFPKEFEDDLPNLQRESSFQYEAVLDYLGGERALSNRKVFFIGDGYTSEGAKAASLLNDYVAGYYIINGEDSLGNHNTMPDWVDGFGPLGETAPWINFLLKQSPLMESRDESRFHSIAVAQQAHKVFSAVLEAQELSEEVVPTNEVNLEGEM